VNVQRLTTAVVVALCAGLVVYPLGFLLLVAGNTGDPQAWPPKEYGVANLAGLFREPTILINTLVVSAVATVLAIAFGFGIAWILSRTAVPGRGVLSQLMVLPYYVTPLVGALAWAALGGPRSGLINQAWFAIGGTTPLVNIYSTFGIAWVMALFEGSVAFVMISAAMKSMDPSLEEMSHVFGAGKLRTMLRVTLPLLTPAVLGAAVFVFAEMVGSFTVPAILGMPERFFVVTTAIYTLILRFPPDYPQAAAMGLSLFVIMAALMYLYRRLTKSASYVTITGRGFRPRVVAMGRARWPLFGVCSIYVVLAIVLPIATLLYASFLRFVTVKPSNMIWTLDNYHAALGTASIRHAIGNSLLLGVYTATIGVPLMGLLSWIIYRTRLPGALLIEYLVMFPASVPRIVFGLGLLLAWVVMPIPLYGTLWLLLIAYLTVFLPLGFRTISGVVLQLDRSLEECARVCGASWGYQLRTVTMPLLRPGLVAAWMLLFIASVREVGASLFLMGPHSKVIGPAVLASWETSGQQLTAAMALLQMLIVFIALTALLGVAGRLSRVEGE
jgi:iron(III) transport system permease protein